MTKKFLFALLALAFASLSVAAGESVTFYVSPEAIDGGDGSSGRPWNSLSLALGEIGLYMISNPGSDIRLELGGGSYQVEEPLVFSGKNVSGTLKIVSADGERACLKGDRAVTGWKKYRKNIWKADLRSCGISDFGLPVGYENRVDLYCDNRRQTLARWPDSGFTTAGKALGTSEIPSPAWIQYHGTKEGRLGYVDERIDRWAGEKDGYAFGYFYWDWSEHVNKIDSVYAGENIITFRRPYSHYGYRDGCRFYGFNMMCELDSPEEYYIDREKGILYWVAPEGVKPSERNFTLSVYGGDFMLDIRSASEIEIGGIDFCGGRKGAVSVSGGENVAIRDCRFSCFGDVAVNIEGGRGHCIDRCSLRELGRGGIRAIGGDRKTLEPSGFTVSNTLVENFSLFQRTYQPAIYFRGAGFLVSHNCFRESSSSALRLEGNDITVEYNQFFDLVNESDDQGATDVWYNYSFRRTVYRYNHFRNIYGSIAAGAAGIRFDDIISGQVVYGNVFEHCGGAGFGGVQIHGGNHNWISNNLFYDCHYAISCTPWTDGHFEEMFEGQMGKCEEVDCFGDLYRTRYPELNQDPSFNHNTNFSSDNLAVNCRALYLRPDNLVTRNDSLVKDSPEALQYFLQPPVLAAYGLRPIPFDEIGIIFMRIFAD